MSLFLFISAFFSLECAPTWVNPPSYQSGVGNTEGDGSSLVSDSEGNIVFIFNDAPPSFSYKPLGGAWGAKTAVTNTGMLFLTPVVADGNNNFYLGGQLPDYSAINLYMLPASTQVWNQIFTAPTPANNYALNVFVATNNAGDVVIAWILQNNLTAITSVMYSIKYSTDSTFSTPDTIATYSQPSTGIYGLALDTLGNATILVYDNITTVYQGYVKPMNLPWSSAYTLATSSLTTNPTLVLDPSNNAVNAFIEMPTGSVNNLFVQTAAPGTNVWSAPLQISNDNYGTSQQIVFDNLGQATAAWLSSPIEGNIYEALKVGGTWQPSQLVVGGGSILAIGLGLAANESGYTVLTWGQYDSTANTVLPSVTTKATTTSTWDPITMFDGIDNEQTAIGLYSFFANVDPAGNPAIGWNTTFFGTPPANFPTTEATTALIIPTVTNVTPNTGSTGGGESIVIAGTNFSGATSVDFGTNAALYVIDSTTQITAIAPAGSAGTVDVTVTNTDGTSPVSVDDVYTYSAPLIPTITNVAPNTGPTAGNNIVIITGTNFIGTTDVLFGTVAGTAIIVNSSTQITVTAPAGSLGTVDITVTTPDGTSAFTVDDQYTYVEGPAISNLSVHEGPPNGGNTVIITGTNFFNVSALFFGTTQALSFTVDSPTQITATAPPGALGSEVNARVMTNSGVSPVNANTQYVYVATTIFPPTNVVGKQQSIRFLTQQMYVNVITWTPPTTGVTPVSYRVYSDAGLTSLLGQVTANNPLLFEIPNPVKGATNTYYIVSVASDGIVSVAAAVTIAPNTSCRR